MAAARRREAGPVGPLQVVFVVPWGERLGGAENLLHILLGGLDRSLWSPAAVFLKEGSFAAEVEALGVPAMTSEVGRLRRGASTVRDLHRLRRTLKSLAPDLVVRWGTAAQVLAGGAEIPASRSVPAVWWQHETPVGHWSELLGNVLPASHVVCDSEVSAGAQWSLWPRRPVSIVQPGVPEPARASAEDVLAFKERMAIPPGRTVVGIVGRLHRLKGQDRFLSAVERLAGAGEDVHGLVVGGDAHALQPHFEAELREFARSGALAGRVTFTGHVPDPAVAIQAMDVAVNASRSEAFGLAVVEAMAVGLPVVAVASTGAAEIVEHGRTGLVVGSGEPTDLAAAIRSLGADTHLRRTLGAAGRTRYLERFTAAAFCDRASALLSRLTRSA